VVWLGLLCGGIFAEKEAPRVRALDAVVGFQCLGVRERVCLCSFNRWTCAEAVRCSWV